MELTGAHISMRCLVCIYGTVHSVVAELSRRGLLLSYTYVPSVVHMENGQSW